MIEMCRNCFPCPLKPLRIVVLHVVHDPYIHRARMVAGSATPHPMQVMKGSIPQISKNVSSREEVDNTAAQPIHNEEKGQDRDFQTRWPAKLLC